MESPNRDAAKHVCSFARNRPQDGTLLLAKGIHSWEFFSDEHAWSRAPFSRKRYKALRVHLDRCRERLHAWDPAYFADALTPKLLWRLFAEFRECAAYLDIETTGLGGPDDHITTAALYDGRKSPITSMAITWISLPATSENTKSLSPTTALVSIFRSSGVISG